MPYDNIVKTVKDSCAHLLVFIELVFAALVIIYLCTGIYTIEQNKIGVLQRFGRVIDDAVKPGMHYALPWPISRVDKIAVKEMKILDINDFGKIIADGNLEPVTPIQVTPETQRSSLQTPAQTDHALAFKRLTGLDPYCITGDNNIVNISLVIKYNVTKPVSYLFKVKNPELLLKSIAAAAIIHSVAPLPVDEILTTGKGFIAREIKRKTQQKLDALDAGITISFVELRYVSPPESVQSYFDDVINAKVEQIRLLDDAESYRNQEVLRAKSDAYAIKQKAESYRQEKVYHAQGEAMRFLAQLEEYQKAEKTSRKRIYLEFMQIICPRLKHIIAIDNRGREKPLTVRVLTK